MPPRIANRGSHVNSPPPNTERINEAIEWSVEEKHLQGQEVGSGFRPYLRKLYTDPANGAYEVDQALKRKREHDERERKAEMGSREEGERAAARSEDQRRRRILLSAHGSGCRCMVGSTGLPEGVCKELPRARLIPIRQIEVLRPKDQGGDGKIKDLLSAPPTPEWKAYYSDHLEKRADTSIFDWVSAIGGELLQRIHDVEKAKGEDWSLRQLSEIRDFCEKRFARKFRFYGPAYWKNTALTDFARRRFEEAVNRHWSRLECAEEY